MSRSRISGHESALMSLELVVELMKSSPRPSHLSRQQHRALIRSLEERVRREPASLKEVS